jgi:hypothetical protein
LGFQLTEGKLTKKPKKKSNLIYLCKRAFSGQDPIKSWGNSAGGNGGVNSKYVGESGIFRNYFKIDKIKKLIFFLLYIGIQTYYEVIYFLNEINIKIFILL